MRAFFGPKVYETVIPRNVKVAEAPSHGKPILLYDYDCAGSQAYIRLATEIIERERQLQGRLNARDGIVRVSSDMSGRSHGHCQCRRAGWAAGSPR